VKWPVADRDRFCGIFDVSADEIPVMRISKVMKAFLLYKEPQA
jgi:hypothetical protein